MRLAADKEKSLPFVIQRMPRPFTALSPFGRRGYTLVELMLVVLIVAVLSAIAFPTYAAYRKRVDNMKALTDIAAMSTMINLYARDNRANPANLAAIGSGGAVDPWGNPYVYYDVAANGRGHARKDHALNPINSDYDLYSMGPDGQTKPQITQKESLDDLIRANNGNFIGVAADF